MKIIYNDIIPVKGFKAINLFGVLFVRNGFRMSDVDINHEGIHTAQMKELLYIGFYLLYVLEWLCKLLVYWNGKKAYHAISFEREAYWWQHRKNYLETRKHYQWASYIRYKTTY